MPAATAAAPCTTASSWWRAAPSAACASASTIARLAKINAYTDQQVADLAARGKSFGQWRLLTEMPLWFFKYYVMRKQFIHGFYGFTTSLNAAFGRYLRIAKLIEWQRDQARKQQKP